MDAFNMAFDEAWFDLTTTYGSGTWANNAKCDNGEFPEFLRTIENPDVSKYKNLNMLGDDIIPPTQTPPSSVFIAGTFFGVLVSVLIGLTIKRGRSKIYL